MTTFDKINFDLPQRLDKSFLDKIKILTIKNTSQVWYENFGLLTKYIESNGKFPFKGTFLGNWLGTQRVYKNKGILDEALEEAEIICKEDEESCKKIGINGLNLIKGLYERTKKTVNILTHCNAGWLATINWGTATSPIYMAYNEGIPIHVWVDETRPRNQGANLTSFELNEENIPNTIISDNTGGLLMQRGMVDMCIVGSDRTLLNGDVCNKVGTYLKALAAYDNQVPFYVALPSSTIDWNLKDSKDIPIEERNSKELSYIRGVDKNNDLGELLIYPKKSKSLNLAFDITPAKYVTALITEKGICEPTEKSIRASLNY